VPAPSVLKHVVVARVSAVRQSASPPLPSSNTDKSPRTPGPDKNKFVVAPKEREPARRFSQPAGGGQNAVLSREIRFFSSAAWGAPA
jgi:hypothetical protein